MPGQGNLWFATFAVDDASADVNAALRDGLLTLIEGFPGVTDTVAGCRGVDAGWRYILIATADTQEAIAALDVEVTSCIDRLPVPARQLKTASRDVALCLRFPRPEPMRILRVYEGRLGEGMLDAYVAAARRGTLEDAARGHGPGALFLTPTGDSTFTTFSLWSDWAEIEAATGGDIRRPMVSKRHAGLIGGEAAHYQLVAEPRLASIEPD